MKYLVTGGAGFIGSHLTERLIQENHEIIVLDNLYSGKLENIDVTKVKFVNGDICDQKLVTELMDQVDGCFHLAAITSVELSKIEWLYTNRVNLGGTINIFNSAARKKIKVVYASSAAIYGDNTKLPLCESLYPNPISSYGIDKFSCELQGKIAANIHDVPNIGFRFFNVYGPKQDSSSPYSGVITKFIECTKTESDISIYGDGEQFRDFIYVTDVVEYLIKAMNKSDIFNGVFNLCTGISTTINNLANLIIQEAKIPIKINYYAKKIGDIKYSVGDNSLSISTLDVIPNVSIIDGIKKLTNYFNESNK